MIFKIEILKISHMDRTTRQPVTEKFYSHELGFVIRGSKDWFGGRQLRQSKRLTTGEEAAYEGQN